MTDFVFETKYCPQCKESKPKAIHFSVKGRTCKDCVKKVNQEYRKSQMGCKGTQWTSGWAEIKPKSFAWEKDDF